MKTPSPILKDARLNQPTTSYSDFIRQVQEHARTIGRSNRRIKRAVPPDQQTTIESLFPADLH